MSTRSILAIRKGDEVRYCFIHWDGCNHGETLKGMPREKMEAIFDKLSDTKHAYGFSTFRNPEGVAEMVKYYTEALKESPGSAVYTFSLIEYREYDYLPHVFTDVYGRPERNNGGLTSGAFQLKGAWPKDGLKFPFMRGDNPIFIEFVWTYDMESGKIGYYTCWNTIPKLKRSKEYSRHIFNGESFNE